MCILTKRVYDPPAEEDGTRILIDRLWPRGLSKEKASVDYWAKDVAPSHELRRWFGHDSEKWDAFKRRYIEELEANAEGMTALRERIGSGTVTILYGAKETRWNNAVALKEYLEAPGT